MSFNKRYISKESIMSIIKDGNNPYKLTTADSLVMDDWSSKFFDNWETNFKRYQNDRDKLYEDTKFSSNLQTGREHQNFDKLRHLSNILFNLHNEAQWVDIQLTLEILGGEVPENICGKFEDLRKFCIGKIMKSFEK